MKLNQLVNASVARELTNEKRHGIALPFLEYMSEKILEEINKTISLGRYEAYVKINHLVAPPRFTKEEAYKILADFLGEKGYRCDHDSRFDEIRIYW